VTQLAAVFIECGRGVFPGVSLGEYAGLGSGSPQTAPREDRSIGTDFTDTLGGICLRSDSIHFSVLQQSFSGNANLTSPKSGTSGYDPLNVDVAAPATRSQASARRGKRVIRLTGSQTSNMKKIDWYFQDDWKLNRS